MWTAVDNVGYGNRITGIGRDDASGLEQKQSKSADVDANVTIALGGTIQPTNLANPNSFDNDKSFLVFSDNNGSTDFSNNVTATGAPAMLKRMARDFKVEKTNWANTDVTFALDGVQAGYDYYLLINGQFDQALKLDAEGHVTVNSVKLNSGDAFTFARMATPPSTAPGGVKGAALWLKASDNVVVADGTSNVTSWTDLNNAIPFITDSTKNGVALDDSLANFNPTVKFNGNGKMNGGADSAISVHEIFTAAKFNNNQEGTLFSINVQNGNLQGFFRNHSGGPLVQFPRADGNVGTDRQIFAPDKREADSLKQLSVSAEKLTAWENGIAGIPLSSSLGEIGAYELKLGVTNDDSRQLNGHFPELIVYDEHTVLTQNDRDRINSYLALKYGLTLKTGSDANNSATNYVASDGTMMWAAADNAGYGNRITGIGRDDASGLEQKQSKSADVDANVTIALGNGIADTNANNGGTMTNDKTFFTFSDNGQDAVYDTTDDTVKIINSGGTGENLRHMGRVFKVDKTANWADQIITMKVDDSAAAVKANYLVISTDETFDSNDSFYAVTGGTVALDSSSVEDGVYFTFAAAYPELENAQLLSAEVNDDYMLILTFDRSVNLTDLTGFRLTIGGTAIDDLTSITPTVNGAMISLPLTEAQLAAGGQISVGYTGGGNLKDAETGLPVESFNDVIVVNKLNLEKKVNEALGITNDDYSEASWQALQAKIAAAKAALDNAKATQGQVDTALSELQAVIDGLKKSPPEAVSGSFIDGANTITLDFNKAVELGVGTATGAFTVTVGGKTVTVTAAAVDGSDPTKVILTLPETTKLSSDETVHVAYNGASGYLKGEGEDGSPVENFSFDLEDPFGAALQITEPSGNTPDKMPAVSGSVHADGMN